MQVGSFVLGHEAEQGFHFFFRRRKLFHGRQSLRISSETQTEVWMFVTLTSVTVPVRSVSGRRKQGNRSCFGAQGVSPRGAPSGDRAPAEIRPPVR